MYIILSSTFISQRNLLNGAIWEKVFLMVLAGNSVEREDLSSLSWERDIWKRSTLWSMLMGSAHSSKDWNQGSEAKFVLSGRQCRH